MKTNRASEVPAAIVSSALTEVPPETGVGTHSEKERREFLQKANSFDSVRAAVDEGSDFIRSLWVTFVLLGAYLVIATASVTHTQLFLETPIKLPLLDVNLPLVAFFWVSPFIFIILHFYLLLQLVVLAEKIRRLNDVIAAADLDDSLRHNLRLLLPNDLLVQFLAGPRKRRQGAMGFMFRLVAWITVVAGPLALLLLIQYKFLPYQNELVSWTNRFFIALDLSLLWVLWRTVIADTDERRQARHVFRWSARVAGVGATTAVTLMSLIALTFPGERLDQFPPQQWFHLTFSWRFPLDAVDQQKEEQLGATVRFKRMIAELLPRIPASEMDLQDWLKHTPEARRLIPGTLRLKQATLVDLDTLKKIEDRTSTVAHLWEGERTGRFNERRFIAANLSKADLRRSDLQNSSFERANFIGANLSGALMRKVNLDGAVLDNANLNDASLDGSTLIHSSFGSSELRRASLYNSNLRQAWMLEAVLNGAILDGASMEGATLDRASLVGSRLLQTRLSGASMDGALLQGAKLEGAALQGASLRGARFEGANLASAELEGADLAGANLSGALLDDARLQGAIIEDAQFTNASLVGAYVFGMVGTPSFSGARVRDVNTAAVFPVVWRRTAQIDQTVVALWTSIATAQVETLPRREAIAGRMSRLLPKNNEVAIEGRIGAHSQTSPIPDASKYSKTLQEFLTALACRREFAPHIARNLLQSAAIEPQGRNWAVGPYFQLFAQSLLASRTDISACQGAAGFVDADWTRLNRLLEALPQPNPSVVSECACSATGAPFVARALINNGALASVGDQLPAIAAKMRAARLQIETCPGIRHFTEADWKELEIVAPTPTGAPTAR
jgi:uncharacterized protein YjbI with pentapeptide repeats